MDKNQFIAQILAQIPDCPHHLASAYLIEFIERLKTNGKQELLQITEFTNDGHAAHLPDKVLSVQKMFANGLEMSTDMDEARAIYELYMHPAPTTATATMLTDELGAILTDEYDNPLEIETA
jgi:hypothetical protein